MFEETNLTDLPKYFKDLHLDVCMIDGTPRISSRKENTIVTDKYKNISKVEWESALLNWAGHLEHGYVQVTKDYAFAVCGKAKNKRHLIQGLRKIADELEAIINENHTIEINKGDIDE